MPGTFLISDLHLSPARPDISRAFASFLAAHVDCDQLFILGDLFEVWVGDDDDSELALEITQQLKRFTDAGPALFIMQGNRDFLLGEAFCRAVGATLLSDPSVVDFDGQATLLMHGDSLCTADEGYQQFRTIARDPQWQADLLARSLDERRAFASQLRGASQEANSNKAEDIMDVTLAEVETVMREHGVQQLIHGHTHRPARHDATTGTRWVLGDWDQKGWAIESGNGSFNLYSFDIKQ